VAQIQSSWRGTYIDETCDSTDIPSKCRHVNPVPSSWRIYVVRDSENIYRWWIRRWWFWLRTWDHYIVRDSYMWFVTRNIYIYRSWTQRQLTSPPNTDMRSLHSSWLIYVVRDSEHIYIGHEPNAVDIFPNADKRSLHSSWLVYVVRDSEHIYRSWTQRQRTSPRNADMRSTFFMAVRDPWLWYVLIVCISVHLYVCVYLYIYIYIYKYIHSIQTYL